MTKAGAVIGAVAGPAIIVTGVVAFVVTGGILEPGWGAGVVAMGVIGAICGAVLGSIASEEF